MTPSPTLHASRLQLLHDYLKLDAALVAAGWHDTSQWFKNELLRFIGAGVPTWVMEVGRRGGKSSFLCRLGVAQAVYGDWKVEPGDTGVVAVVSVSLAEAKQRLKTVRDILDAIGEPYTHTAERVRLKRRRLEFRALACSLGGVIGFTAVAVLADEVAHWRDDSGANPAREVLAKLSPTMATVDSAFMLLASAPDSIATLHHEMFMNGDNGQQIVSNGPTWLANPTISEEKTRALEPNERVWLREYCAVASEHQAEPVFRKEDILRALADGTERGIAIGARVCVLDPSSGASNADAFTFATVGWNERADGQKVMVVDEFDGQRGPFAQFTSPQIIVRKRVRDLCRRHDIANVYSDQHLAPLVEEECKMLNLRFKSFPWTHENKCDAVNKLALLLSRDLIVLPRGNGWLRKELLSFTEKTSRSGKRTYAAKGKQHDDAVSCLLLACRLDSMGLLEGSITARVRRRDPPPFGGGQLQSVRMVHQIVRPSPMRSVKIGNDGRAYVEKYRYRSPISGGGF